MNRRYKKKISKKNGYKTYANVRFYMAINAAKIYAKKHNMTKPYIVMIATGKKNNKHIESLKLLTKEFLIGCKIDI